MNQLSNQTAIITGAASGMGKAMAILFAAEGARVVAADLHQAELDTVVESINQSGGTAIGIPCNVSLESDIRSLIAGAMEHFGSVDILVNNAGVFWIKPLAMETLEGFRKMQAINVEGVFLGLKHCIPVIAERAQQWDGGGAVVNLSSVAGIVGGPNIIAYNASKGAVRLMTKSAALEFAPAKVRVNSVHPGIIDTPMMAEAAKVIEATTGQGSNSTREQFASRHPLGRMGRDVDVANAVAFLASDAAAFVTGSELVVDGGMTAI